MKYLEINCQKHKIGSLVLSSRCMTKYRKTCSFLHTHFTERMKVVETFIARRLRAKFWPDCAIPDTSMKFGTVVDHD